MAGLLPGVLPNLSLPGIGGLLGPSSALQQDNPTPVNNASPQVTRADDDDNGGGSGLELITIINGPSSTATDDDSPAEQTSDVSSTPISDALSTTLQTIVTPATNTLSTSSSSTMALPSDLSATAEAASDAGNGGAMSKGMIATIAGASGAGLVLLVVGVMLVTRRRRGRWPFNKQDDFVTLDDEVEKNSAYNQAKWDPSRAAGLDAGRISRFISNQHRA